MEYNSRSGAFRITLRIQTMSPNTAAVEKPRSHIQVKSRNGMIFPAGKPFRCKVSASAFLEKTNNPGNYTPVFPASTTKATKAGNTRFSLGAEFSPPPPGVIFPTIPRARISSGNLRPLTTPCRTKTSRITSFTIIIFLTFLLPVKVAAVSCARIGNYHTPPSQNLQAE